MFTEHSCTTLAKHFWLMKAATKQLVCTFLQRRFSVRLTFSRARLLNQLGVLTDCHVKQTLVRVFSVVGVAHGNVLARAKYRAKLVEIMHC